MKILSCNSNRPLAEAIAVYLDVSLTNADVKRFADMEVFVEIGENVRGEDVFVVQSTCFPANDNVMGLLVALGSQALGSPLDAGAAPIEDAKAQATGPATLVEPSAVLGQLSKRFFVNCCLHIRDLGIFSSLA